MAFDICKMFDKKKNCARLQRNFQIALSFYFQSSLFADESQKVKIYN